MFRSLRWRLIISYISLALFTLIVAGVLAFWAALKYFDKLETDHLKRNGQAIAEQAYPYLSPFTSDQKLIQLVQAASFYGNMQVKILDASGEILVDSGYPEEKDLYAWLVLSPEYQANLPEDFESAEWYISIIGSFPADILDELSNQGWREIMIPQLSKRRLIPLSVLRALPPDTSLNFFQRDNSPWGSILSFGVDQELNDLDPTLSLDDREEYQSSDREKNEIQRSTRIVGVPIGDEQHPIGSVEVSQALDFSSQALSTFQQALIVSAAGAIIIAIVIGWYMGGRISAPVVSLTSTAEQMSSGNLAIRANVSGKDEIGTLASQFNTMAEQLEQSFSQVEAERDSLRRFIADASHEMRTPITALRNFNELLMGSGGSDPEIQKEFLHESRTQIERLAWLTNNLLDLSRLDAGIIELDLQFNPALDLINSVISGFEHSIKEKNIDIYIDQSARSKDIYGDRGRIEIALRNILDNAFKYSPQGGRIDISLKQVNGEIQLSVADKGSGIHPEDLPYIFDRFYRGVDHQQPGSGLGLAIVKSIMEAHGGRVEVESELNAGAIFTLVFPSSNSI